MRESKRGAGAKKHTRKAGGRVQGELTKSRPDRRARRAMGGDLGNNLELALDGAAVAGGAPLSTFGNLVPLKPPRLSKDNNSGCS